MNKKHLFLLFKKKGEKYRVTFSRKIAFLFLDFGEKKVYNKTWIFFFDLYKSRACQQVAFCSRVFHLFIQPFIILI